MCNCWLIDKILINSVEGYQVVLKKKERMLIYTHTYVCMNKEVEFQARNWESNMNGKTN